MKMKKLLILAIFTSNAMAIDCNVNKASSPNAVTNCAINGSNNAWTFPGGGGAVMLINGIPTEMQPGAVGGNGCSNVINNNVAVVDSANLITIPMMAVNGGFVENFKAQLLGCDSNGICKYTLVK